MTYDEIQDRAEQILEAIDLGMNEGNNLDSPDLLDGYKASFCLAKRDLNIYRRSFSDSGLMFCIDSAEAIYEDLSESLSGYKGLTYQEREILKEALQKINN